MAIRLTNTSSESLTRTTDLLSHNANYTRMMYVYLVSDLNAFACLCSVGVPPNHETLFVDSTGTTLFLEAEGGATGYVSTSGSSLSVGVWAHITVRRNGTSLTVLKDGGQVLSVTHDSSGRTAPTIMEIGKLGAGDFHNIRVAALKHNAAAFSDSEVANEMHTYAPLNHASLHSWSPFWDAADLNDYSGNGRNWTGNNTPTTEDGPPIIWAPKRRVYVFPGVSLAPSIPAGIINNPIQM